MDPAGEDGVVLVNLLSIHAVVKHQVDGKVHAHAYLLRSCQVLDVTLALIAESSLQVHLLLPRDLC